MIEVKDVQDIPQEYLDALTEDSWTDYLRAPFVIRSSDRVIIVRDNKVPMCIIGFLQASFISDTTYVWLLICEGCKRYVLGAGLIRAWDTLCPIQGLTRNKYQQPKGLSAHEGTGL